MRVSEATLNPASSTYYSHRVFMIYEPDDFRDYLGKIVAGRDWPVTEQARHLMAWGTILVYQARMDPFAFNECMNRYIDEKGEFRHRYEGEGVRSEAEKARYERERPDSDPMFRMQLTMQLALEAVTRHANITARIDDAPARGQLVFDTLYYVGDRLHAHDRTAGDRDPHKFHVCEANLQDYLRRRAEGDRGDGLPADFLGADERRFLFGLLREYVHLLSEPEDIRRRTLDFAQRQSDRRIGKLWEDLAFGILPEKVIALAECAKPNEIAFSFRMDRYGVNPDELDPLARAKEAAGALGDWESLLRELLGDPEEAARMAAEARLLERFPEWKPVSEARRRTLQTVETDGAAAAANADDRELRRAALVMRDYLRMLDQWSIPFARGAIAAALAASAARTGEPAARRRIAFEALRVLCGFDPRDAPGLIAERLGEQFGPKAWPAPFDTRLMPEREPEPSFPLLALMMTPEPRRSAFAQSPTSLTDFCKELSHVIRPFGEDNSPKWAAIWSEFWKQWSIPGAAVDAERVEPSNPTVAELKGSDAERVKPSNPPLALDLLHTVQHGAIPVIPKQGGNLSIGEWCRVLTLAGSEPVPENALKAARAALGFPEEANKPLPDRAEREPPILLISVASTRSPAWRWRPQPGVRALMLMPADIVAAENWHPEDHPEAAGQILPRRGLRSGQILHCIETGLDIRPRYEPVYFGSRPPAEGASRYIGNPTSVADLAERLRRAEEPPSVGVFRLVFRTIWRALRSPVRSQQPDR